MEAAPDTEPAPAPPGDLGTLASDLDGGIGWRARIGLLVLATDQTIEHEWRTLVGGPGIALYGARLFNDADITPETLAAIGPRVAPATALVLPGVPLDVVAFGCTSATMTLGEEAVFAAIRAARPGVACTTPVTAAFAAFEALGVRRIGLLTPYSARVNANLVRFFEGRGVEVAARATFDRPDDLDAARISVAAVEAGATALAGAPGVEAVFVSCTSLRVASAVSRIEAATGLPVTSSNHAMAWHALRLAGIDEPLPSAGRLFATVPVRRAEAA